MTKTQLIILVVALFVGFSISAHQAEAATVAETLNAIERTWVDTCVEYPDDNLSGCVSASRAAIQHMREGLAEADHHPGLKALVFYTSAACSDEVDPTVVKAEKIPGLLAGCVVKTYDAVIEEKGGMVEYLIWFQALNDPEV